MGKAKRKSSRPTSESITPFLAPIQALQYLLSKFNDQGVIIGGVAVSLLGTPRYTVDIDAVVLLSIEELPHLIQEAAAQGIFPRIADPITFAHKNKILLLRHTASGIDIDLSLGMLPFEFEMVKRSHLIEIGAITLRLPTPEDLIIMKSVAHRPKDLMDIEAIANNHPNLDKEWIRFWVEQFGEALNNPELWKDISKYL